MQMKKVREGWLIFTPLNYLMNKYLRKYDINMKRRVICLPCHFPGFLVDFN